MYTRIVHATDFLAISETNYSANRCISGSLERLANQEEENGHQKQVVLPNSLGTMLDWLATVSRLLCSV